MIINLNILIFKKNEEISGVAKICLSCSQFYLISSKKEIKTDNFGTEEEYKGTITLLGNE